MGRRKVVFVGFLVGLFALTTLLAGSNAPSSKITVGDFAVLVASRMNVDNSQEAVTPAVASDILKKHGVKINANLSNPLTEKDAADLFGQLGISLQTDHPGDLLSAQRAANIVGIFGENLASKGSQTDSTLASRSGATSMSGVSVETTIYDCQALPKPPAPCVGPQSVCNPCMDCCKNQLGKTGKECGQACQRKNLTTSAVEPTP
jgi:hypothetical protein